MLAKEERRLGMESYLDARLEEIFYERTLETFEYFHVNKDKLLSSLMSAIGEARVAVEPSINSGSKQRIKFVQFSYLLSAAKMNKLILKIDMYDARHYGDLISDGGYWDYSELFPYINEDMQLLRDELSKRFLRIKDYEIADIRLYYHTGIFQMMWAVLMELAIEETFLEILSEEFEPTVHILFGAYLDKAEVVGTISKGAE